MSVAQTLAACLTPPGSAAIATLGIRGPEAWTILRRLFKPRSSGTVLPELPVIGRIWLGRLGDDVADEVVIAMRTTHPLEIDVHAHGGIVVVRLLLEALDHGGAKTTSWQIFEAARHGTLRTSAQEALARSLTPRTAMVLLDQFSGAFANAVAALQEAARQEDHTAVTGLLAPLRAQARLGRRLTEPWRVAVAGAPNVGKSSIVNALAGYSRCVVSPIPGTTRDLVSVTLALDGWPVNLIDTAGLRHADTSLEQAGVSLSHMAMAEADLCLWVVDRSAAPVWPPDPSVATLTVVNKLDLPAAWTSPEEHLLVSAQTGAGVEALGAAIANRLVPVPPAPGAAVPFTAELCDRLEALASCLSRRDWSGVEVLLRELTA